MLGNPKGINASFNEEFAKKWWAGVAVLQQRLLKGVRRPWRESGCPTDVLFFWYMLGIALQQSVSVIAITSLKIRTCFV
jgi:hypothetical protein